MKRKRFGLQSISGKIAGSIILLTLVILISVSVTVGVVMRRSVGEDVKSNATSQVSGYANEFDKELMKVEGVVEGLAIQMASRTDVDQLKNSNKYQEAFETEYIQILKDMGTNLGLTDSIYVYYNAELFDKEIDLWLYNDGNGFEHMLSLGAVDYYMNAEAWYSDPIINGTSQWSFPYAAAETGVLITSYTTPIIKDGQIIGLVGMDIPLSNVAARLSELKLYESGYLYLIANDGQFIYHPSFPWSDEGEPSSLLETGEFQWLLDDMNANESHYITYERSDGTNVVAAFDHLDNGWILGSSIPESEVFKQVNVVISILIGITIGAIVIAFLVSIIIGRSISNPILRIVSVTEQIKNGDFTARVQLKSKDETKHLADAINDMSENICQLIIHTKGVSKNMLDSASSLAAMSQETNATVEQVATTIDDIAKGTMETANEAERSAMVVSVMDEKFATLMENSITMQTNTDEAIKMNEEGINALKRLEDKSIESKEANNKIASAVKNLDEKATAITAIIATISSIATQTNLLALNASIEAARAGEAGKGFAVVADEIRKLAEDSSSATEQIKKIVLMIQSESKETVVVMDGVEGISKEQNEVVVMVNEALSKIIGSVDNIAKEIKEVNEELTELNEQKNLIVEIANTISAVSQETAAGTEEVNASMVKQTSVVEEVARNAETLNGLSVELNDSIEVFIVE